MTSELPKNLLDEIKQHKKQDVIKVYFSIKNNLSMVYFPRYLYFGLSKLWYKWFERKKKKYENDSDIPRKMKMIVDMMNIMGATKYKRFKIIDLEKNKDNIFSKESKKKYDAHTPTILFFFGMSREIIFKGGKDTLTEKIILTDGDLLLLHEPTKLNWTYEIPKINSDRSSTSNSLLLIFRNDA